LLLTDVVARFGYAELGLTDTARRQQHLTRYLIEYYQALLKGPVPQRFQALAEETIRALQGRAVRTFDEYLERLRQVAAGLAATG
jgi:hypothetical protein